ncbi:TIGR01777 family oxidoreductase [Corynebacterium mendelii]|uniref:TIGR01777 family oxidoreductase n=1 Tax=Corynebacterium mendelii TaxID=2765362 RepID=A0A939IT32_9CORY|nr:TIGR01777 family oxidoreductase [Corynebacterium mendelii]MBN9643414.1 TIGR01777 family oxidoreductase [Corynebacterium mendelii]
MTLTTSHFLPSDRQQVWNWHTRPGAVVRLTAPFTYMTPVEQASNLRDGKTVFAMPAGLRWVAQHRPDGYRDGHQFTDEVVSHPFAAATRWVHRHTFSTDSGGTIITDRVATTVPGFVLTAPFAYRQHQLIADFAFLKRLGHWAGGLDTTATVAVTGSSGTVGRQLTAQLSTLGFSVIKLVRSHPAAGERLWNPDNPDPDLLQGTRALIHLAGAPIAGRFTTEHQQAVRDSRVRPTEKLAELVARTPSVDTMVSASAVGYYGADRGEEKLSESSSSGDDFLAAVCRDWEKATAPAEAAGKRVVRVRTGLVLAGNGGLLPILRHVFLTGFGGRIGSGNAWFPWIAIDDLTDIYIRATFDDSLTGPINAVAPNPVRNKTMSKKLAAVLHRPALVPVPRWAPGIVLGAEGAQQTALSNQRVVCTALDSAGHQFRYPSITGCLAHELGAEKPVGVKNTG